jgi:hypothetical protein
VVFTDRQPASCTQTAGMSSGAVPPLPAFPAADGWAGNCTFNAAGTYTFVCGQHASMTGAVLVGEAPGTTNTDTTGTGTTGTTTGGPDGSPKPPRVKVKRRQRGVVVRGSVTTPAGPSRIQVRAFVAKKALASPAASAKRLVRVGSFSKRSTGTGRTAFSIRLKRTARVALKRRGRLAVRLRIAVTPAGGRPTVTTAAVALRSK